LCAALATSSPALIDQVAANFVATSFVQPIVRYSLASWRPRHEFRPPASSVLFESNGTCVAAVKATARESLNPPIAW
jgi:hypothetical protein